MITREPTKIETEYIVQWYRKADDTFATWGLYQDDLDTAKRVLDHLRTSYQNDQFRIVKHSTIHVREYLDA
jgi:hypothetical protein